MKISVNDIEIFSLTETQENVMKYVISSDIFEDDMKRRLEWVIMHAHDEWFKTLKEDWDPKLIELGVESIPTNKDTYAQLVLSQPTYKDRKARDLEAAALNQGA
jgi:hypothetical protein